MAEQRREGIDGGAVEALAETVLFSGLPTEDLARLAVELEEMRFEAGRVIFQEDDAADGLYIIRSGLARVLATVQNLSHDTLAMLGPGEHFGEMALVSDAPRSATVVAMTPLVAWRLSNEHFRDLVQRHPDLPMKLAAALSRRLTMADREISRGRQNLDALGREALAALPGPAREALMRSAPLREIDLLVLERALDRGGLGPIFESISRQLELVERVADGRYRFTEDWLRPSLTRALMSELGDREYREWLILLADSLEASRKWQEAAELAREAGDPRRAERLLRRLDQD